MSDPISSSKLNPSAVEFVPSFLQNKNFQPPSFQSDVDPFEMEARCEAVVEILQDDRIRDQLNPAAQQAASPQNTSDEVYDNACEEEDMMEMMAMQEECRLEMMKFYIQSQNPNLFEEIYHDVSYPEKLLEPKKKTEKEVKVEKAKDAVINDLNTNSPDYVPKKLSQLDINK